MIAGKAGWLLIARPGKSKAVNGCEVKDPSPLGHSLTWPLTTMMTR
jgi:hypothetical protein